MTTIVRGRTPIDDGGLARLVSDFEAQYERKYGKGSAFREAGIEMTMFRLTARGLIDRPQPGASGPGRCRRRARQDRAAADLR